MEKLKADFHARRMKAGFNPNQPRVPAGNPDGGQWTDAEGGPVVTVNFAVGGKPETLGDSDSTPSLLELYDDAGLQAGVISDANPDPIYPWVQYAQSRTQITSTTGAWTGISTIDDTTAKLSKSLA